MSIKALAEYTRVAKYAKYLPEHKRRETWQEQVQRVFDMHREYYKEHMENEEFQEMIEFAEKMLLRKRILGSQRALQFGGDPILKKNERLYNCSATYVDRPKVFQESMYLLLCGCGVGFSVQKHHIKKLPNIKLPDKGFKNYVIPDTIEGWADACGVLMSSYFDTNKTPFPEFRGYKIRFDYSNIRPKGAPLSSGSKAPGPDGLRESLVKVNNLLKLCCNESKSLRPIHAYDILMHFSNAVLSGGVRRSATICLFSPDDNEMATAKTGDWFVREPQRARSNNSVLLIRDSTTKDDFKALMENVKEYGEPGFVWADDTEALFNPCCEIGLYGYNEKGESGVSFCNLCEINMKKTPTEADFYDSCKAAAILGTLQAGYTNFPYLGSVTEDIVKREALLGISMTGMMDTPDIAFNAKIQRNGARMIHAVNEKLAKMIGIILQHD